MKIELTRSDGGVNIYLQITMGNFSVLCVCKFYPFQKSFPWNGITPHCMEKNSTNMMGNQE
jgi:hypothetical protein